MNNNGYKNEVDFVEYFNDKYFYEFDDHTQKFLCELFEFELKNDTKLISWKNRLNQKSDFYIKYNNYVKSISLKCGNGNSVHHESLQEFKFFLEKLNIPYNIIEYYVSYHYGYYRNDGKIDLTKQLDANEYKFYYQGEIDEFNKKINKTKVIIEFVDRFIIRGRNSMYDINALISGIPNNFTWIMKDDIYDLILEKRNSYSSSPHIGCITFGPKKRNIYSTTTNNLKDRYIVAARWNNIFEDITNYTSHK